MSANVAYTLSTNVRLRGSLFYGSGPGVRVRRLTAAGQPNLAPAGVLRVVSRPAPVGTCTGRQLVPASGPGWLEVTDAQGKAGWVRYDLMGSQPVETLKSGDGAALVRLYLRNENDLARKLAKTGELLARLRARRGVGGTALDGYFSEQKRLELRLADRRRRVLAANDVIKVTSKIDPWGLVFKPTAIRKWYGLSAVQGVGVVPVLVWVVGAVVLTGLSYGAYKALFPDAKASEADLQKHKALAKGLALLRAAGYGKEADALEADVNNYGQEQANAGKAQADQATGPIAETGTLLKWATVGFLAFKFLL